MRLLAGWYLSKSRHGCCPADIFKSSDIIVVLLTFLKIQTWLLSYWHLKKKESRHGCHPAGTFKIKSSDMVVVLLTLS